MTAVLEVEALTKSYGATRALDQVSLRIEAGEIFALLGPNGAGKTTLIGAVCGLVRKTSGRIALFGQDLDVDPRTPRYRVGLVPQEINFDPFFTVRESLRIQQGYFGQEPDEARIDELLTALSLTAKANAQTRALSGGMKRRLLIAKALVHRPKLVFLDEPTAGVDVELRQGLWQFVRRLNREGHTIVLTTHYLEEAQELCGRIGMLRGGRLIALDDTSRLLQRLAGLQVSLRLSGPLPERLRPQLVQADAPRYVLRLAQPAEVEGVLAACREAGAAIEEIEVGHADLEDVFLQMMSEEPTGVPA